MWSISLWTELFKKNKNVSNSFRVVVGDRCLVGQKLLLVERGRRLESGCQPAGNLDGPDREVVDGDVDGRGSRGSIGVDGGTPHWQGRFHKDFSKSSVFDFDLHLALKLKQFITGDICFVMKIFNGWITVNC